MPFVKRCLDCGGTGECSKCFGTGVNTALNSGQQKCSYCAGTGNCPTCRREPEIITLGLLDD